MTETTVERTRIEREVAEAVRRENEGIVHRFFTLSRELLSIADIDGCLRRVNPAWEATLGWTPDDLTGKPFVDFVHPDDRAGTLAAIEQLATGQGLVAFENRYRCKDGSFRWLRGARWLLRSRASSMPPHVTSPSARTPRRCPRRCRDARPTTSSSVSPHGPPSCPPQTKSSRLSPTRSPTICARRSAGSTASARRSSRSTRTNWTKKARTTSSACGRRRSEWGS